jgi:hypothetical protein
MFASDSASSMKIDEFSVTVVSHLLSKFSRPLRHRAQFSKCLGSMPTRTSWAFLRSVIAVGTPGMFSPPGKHGVARHRSRGEADERFEVAP